MVFKVFSMDSVQQRRLPLRNAFLSGLWSRSLIFPFLVDVFMVLAQVRVHPLLLILQLVFKKMQMSLVNVFFALFPKNKKSAKLGPHSSPRVPSSVSSSTPAAQLVVEPVPVSSEWVQLRDGDAGKTYYWNRRTNQTVWQPPAGVEVVWVGTWEERVLYYWHKVTRASMYELPGEERHRQPRAVYKYWAPCRLCCVEIFFIVNNGHWFCVPHGTLLVVQAITMVQLPLALWVYVHFRAVWTTFISLSVSSAAMVSQMS